MLANIPVWVDFLVCHLAWPVAAVICATLLARAYVITHTNNQD